MANVLMATENGETHGLINTLPNSVTDDGFKDMSPEMKSKCEKQKKEDNRMVKARYINHRGNHERLTKPYMRWAGDVIKIYHLIPGKTYDLPKGFVDEVNNNPGLAKRGERVENDQVIMRDGTPEKLHELVPISF